MKPRVRMIVGVDGVVADLHGHILRAVGSTLSPLEVIDRNLFSQLTFVQQETARQVMAEPDFWLSMPVLPGAVEGIQTFQLRGHQIVWATAPWTECKQWEWARRAWLAQHFSARSEDIAVLFEKQWLTGDFFVDDSPESVVAWQRAHAHGAAFLYHAPYNADFLWPQRLDWSVKEEEDGQEDPEDSVRGDEG